MVKIVIDKIFLNSVGIAHYSLEINLLECVKLRRVKSIELFIRMFYVGGIDTFTVKTDVHNYAPELR